MTTLYILAVAAGVVVALEGLFHGVRLLARHRSEELRRRVQGVASTAPPEALLKRGRIAEHPAVGQFLRSIPFAVRTERLLEAAASHLTVARLWGYSLALLLIAALASLLLRLAFVPTLVLVLVAPALPTALLLAAAHRRSRAISEQLPDALDMMARSLRAGHATSSALQMVATEMPEPVNVEFARAFEEQRLGLPLEEAIANISLRMPNNRDLKIFAVSAIVQKQTGGNLAEVLGSIADTIRARYRFEGKLRGLTAEGRASALILALLPLAFVAILQFMNRGYLSPLLQPGYGRLILFYAVCSWAIGLVWLYRLTKVDL